MSSSSDPPLNKKLPIWIWKKSSKLSGQALTPGIPLPPPAPPYGQCPYGNNTFQKGASLMQLLRQISQDLWMLSPPVSQVRSLIIVHEIWTIFIAEFCAWKLWCNLHLVTLLWFLPAAEHLASLVNCSNEYEAVGGGRGCCAFAPSIDFSRGEAGNDHCYCRSGNSQYISVFIALFHHHDTDLQFENCKCCVWWKTTQEHINSALSLKDDEMMAKSYVIRYGQVIVKSYGRFLK